MAKPVNTRVRRHREALRKAGLRPVQLWVPDTRRPDFAAECRRQSALLRGNPSDREVASWVEAIQDLEGWT